MVSKRKLSSPQLDISSVPVTDYNTVKFGTARVVEGLASCLNPRPGFHRPVVEVLWPRQHPTPLPTSVVWSEFVRGVGNFFYKSTSTLPLAMLRFAWFCFALPGFAFRLALPGFAFCFTFLSIFGSSEPTRTADPTLSKSEGSRSLLGRRPGFNIIRILGFPKPARTALI